MHDQESSPPASWLDNVNGVFEFAAAGPFRGLTLAVLSLLIAVLAMAYVFIALPATACYRAFIKLTSWDET
jgi:hypothetical protein